MKKNECGSSAKQIYYYKYEEFQPNKMKMRIDDIKSIRPISGEEIRARSVPQRQQQAELSISARRKRKI